MRDAGRGTVNSHTGICPATVPQPHMVCFYTSIHYLHRVCESASRVKVFSIKNAETQLLTHQPGQDPAVNALIRMAHHVLTIKPLRTFRLDRSEHRERLQVSTDPNSRHTAKEAARAIERLPSLPGRSLCNSNSTLMVKLRRNDAKHESALTNVQRGW